MLFQNKDKLEILNFMLDNNIVLICEYDLWDSLEISHKQSLLKCALSFTKENQYTTMNKKIKKYFKKLLTK